MHNTTIHTSAYKHFFISHAYAPSGGIYYHGFGIHKSEQTSRLVATAELAERTCGISADHSAMEKFCYSECPESIIPLCQLRLLCNRFSADRQYSWEKVEKFRDGREYSVPAGLVYFPFDNDEPAPNEVQTTVGLAAHPSQEIATIKAIHEIAERHFLYKAWTREANVRIIGDKNGMVLLSIDNPLRLHIVLAIIESTSVPYASTGMGTSVSPHEALSHAVKEAYLSEWYNHVIIEEMTKMGESFSFHKYATTPFFMHAFDRGLIEYRNKFYQRATKSGGETTYTSRENIAATNRYFPNIYFKKFSLTKDRLQVVRALIPGADTNHVMLTAKTPVPLL